MVQLVGTPVGDDWEAVKREATSAMHAARVKGQNAGTFERDTHKHRRGAFVATATGVSYGGGQRVCIYNSTLSLGA